ncbi:GlxA family transcriptional regulator [Marinobacter arenosus]|uniref:GlxA family transcriptional regulator n=1 Tax=Marinobacter arenosus TaxID=2856822 RepID=UPI001C4D5A72|nr:helix-turn-helix domain-containing protein [Marinobacter arenosus]MBW0149018.1 helix-turn-helix domain-containing protein [Marinobacter arenosus]
MSCRQKKVLILALPETAGSALYGMVDVLMSTGNIWQTLVGDASPSQPFDVQIVSIETTPFYCGHGIPVQPAYAIADDPVADILILPEIWLGPHEEIRGRYDALMEWVNARFRSGTTIYSACSGSVLLAESGLLDNCEATSHWGYQELFRTHYPKVHFRPETNLVYAHPGGRLVTAGGTTSWHDLALHIIARHVGIGEALRIAKVYLLKWHDEGQLPFTGLVRQTHHADSAVRRCEEWLKEHCRDPAAISRLIEGSPLPERTLKRRFKAATGASMIEYLQNLRIEAAKRLLEEGKLSVEEVSLEAGYEDVSFFRRLFKRLTGLTPGEYRRLFRPLIEESVGRLI